MAENYVYLNHRIVPQQKAMLSVADPGFLYGQGLFETMRAYNGRVFAFERHIKRLFLSLPVVRLRLKFAADRIEEAVYLTLKVNQLKEAYVRLMVWQGEKGVNLAVITRKYYPYPQAVYRRGFKGMISGFKQNEHSALARVKSISYLLHLLARRQAEEKGFDEAILLNSQGLVAEGSRTNIFIVENQRLLTPNLKQGCLNGITRKIVLELARKNKIKIWEGEVPPGKLLQGDEAFLTNSLLEIMPLTSVNRKRIAAGTRGVVTTLLMKEYRDLVNTYIE